MMQQCVKCKKCGHWWNFWSYFEADWGGGSTYRSKLCKTCAHEIAQKAIWAVVKELDAK